MYSAYGEFLSLDRIDSAVDGLNKAFLDSVLIQLRIRFPQREDYKLAVQDFRWHNFHKGIPLSDDYLYWFDLRADFWEKTAIDEQIKAMLAPSDTLQKLNEAALALLRRRNWALGKQPAELSHAEALRSGDQQATPSALGWILPDYLKS